MIYGHTLNLEVLIHTQPVGMKPIFDIVSSTHVLGIEQREGVSLERLREIDECFIHPRLAPSARFNPTAFQLVTALRRNALSRKLFLCAGGF
jgi:hypothetical protein